METYFIYCTTTLLVSMVSLARSDCILSRFLSACQLQIVSDFLVTDIQSGEREVTITCPIDSNFDGWLLARDGITNGPLIDSSSVKYEINDNSLLIRNISITDEGLYTCSYQGGTGRGPKNCIYIVGRAVFASCQLDFSGCTNNPTSLTVTEGESVTFDSTITFLPGGSCGVQQPLGSVELVKINGAEHLRLCYKQKDADSAACSDSRLTLSRGTSPGNEFMFTLSDAVANYSGLYEAVVEVMTYDSTMVQQTLRKRFELLVTTVQVTSDGPIQSTVMMKTDNNSPTVTGRPDFSSTADEVTTDSQESVGSGPDNLLQPIIISIAVVLLIVIIVSLIIVLALVYRCVKKQQQKKEDILVGNQILHGPIADREQPNANGIDGQFVAPLVLHGLLNEHLPNYNPPNEHPPDERLQNYNSPNEYPPDEHLRNYNPPNEHPPIIVNGHLPNNHLPNERPPSNIEIDFSLPHLQGDGEAEEV